MNKVIFTFIFCISCGLCQTDLNDLNLDEIKNSFPALENFNQSALPQKEEIEKLLKEKCEKNGGPNAYEDIINYKDAIQECITKYIDQDKITEELNEAKKHGAMDEVFGKYCEKRPKIMECVSGAIKKIEMCLEPAEKESLKITLNATENIANFSCFRNGDRLAMFVAEGGVECLNSSKAGLEYCMNKTFSARIPKDQFTLISLPIFQFGEQECGDLDKFQKCAVVELEKCSSNTPANIMESLFKFIKKVTPCKNFETKSASARKIKREQGQNSSMFKSFSTKCNKFAGPNAFKDLEVSVYHLKFCIQSALRSQGGCKSLPNEIRNCTNVVINKLRVCLPPQESYIPNFAHRSIDSLLKYMCDNDGENYKKIMRPDALTCMFNQNREPLNNCLNATKVHKAVDDDVIVKTELCDKIDSSKLCLSTFIANHCSEIPDFKEVTVGLMEALKAPCSACSLHLSNLFLLASLLFLLHKLF